MTEELRNFQPKLRRSGLFGERRIDGWQYEDDRGQLAWRVRTWENSGGPIDHYWIEGGNFFEVTHEGGPLNTIPTIRFETGPRIIGMDAAKRDAILNAIAKWEKLVESEIP